MEEGSSSTSQYAEQMGDEVLRICRHEKDQNHHSSCIMTSSLLSPTESSSSSGDYIGSESCFGAFASTEDEEKKHNVSSDQEDHSCRNHPTPPMMPLLARTGNLPSHMPWVLKRVYTADGRLILKEEEVKRHEYFQADRSNGRLRLQLIRLHPVRLSLDEDEDNDNHANTCNDNDDDDEDNSHCCDVKEAVKEEDEESVVVSAGCSSPSLPINCLKFCSLAAQAPVLRRRKNLW